jgi:hypothetical protein
MRGRGIAVCVRSLAGCFACPLGRRYATPAKASWCKPLSSAHPAAANRPKSTLRLAESTHVAKPPHDQQPVADSLEAAATYVSSELLPEHPKIGRERHNTVPARKAMVPLRPAPRPGRYPPALSPERWIAGAVGVGFLICLGVFVYESSRSPVHLALPAPSALPDGEATSSEWDVLVQRAVATVRPSSRTRSTG